MGSHGLCTRTEVRLEDSRLWWEDCMICFSLSFPKALSVQKGIMCDGGLLQWFDYEYIT